mmetsp:Transcript_12658/g.29789  ORF Transcript_12658/g.29789 Transcript_12658/m.29789 type:complete len:327 (-) Transcript_12658:169-1149(-)
MLSGEVRAELALRELPLTRILGDFRGHHPHSVLVAHAAERAFEQAFELVEEPLLVELVEELEVVGAVLERLRHCELDERLGVVHVVLQVGEGHLRLDHPELGEMAAGVGVLRAESRAESIDVAQRARHGLSRQLAGDGEEGRLAEEVLRVVDLLVGGQRHQLRLGRQGGDPEHLTSALTVARRDQRRLHVTEALALEELVRGLRERGAHARDGGDRVGPRAQVGDGAQEFERGLLLLNRVGGAVARADQLYPRGLDLEGLPLGGGGDDVSPHGDGRTGAQRLGHAVALHLARRDHLHGLDSRAVVELDEAEGLLLAHGAHPPLEHH